MKAILGNSRSVPLLLAQLAALVLAIGSAAPPAPQVQAAGLAPTVGTAGLAPPVQPAARGPAAALSPSDPLPVDSLVTIGRLPNGLTYYIRKNGWPEKRVALRLAVRVGSVQEDDDQQGLAHFMEHMNFNGSQHFKPGELVAYLESIGARFGPDANAFTNFDQTLYLLDVPTDPDSLLDKGILVLSDYAARATLSDEEINKERGVVTEEWRLGQGAGDRMRRVQYPILYHGSRYADRLPIGKPEVIKEAPPQRIRDFYHKWYRPDLMAVVAVGDIDPARVKNLIEKTFGDIPAAPGRLEVPLYDVPPHQETLYTIATDPEARFSTVSITYKRPRVMEKTVGDYRRQLVESLFGAMLSQRLDEQAKATNAPFLGASAYEGQLGRTVDTFNLGARVADGGIEAGLKALLLEASRVTQHGFGQAELDRAREDLMAGYEQTYNELSKTESSSYAREYVGNFIDSETIPGIPAEYRMARELLPAITLDDVNAASRSLIHDDNRVILANAPAKAGLTPPTGEGLKAVVAAAAATPVAAWVDSLAGRELMADKPAPGRVTGTRTIGEIGVTILTLSNGAAVWLKPTDFKNDEILFSAYALGGASLADPTHYQEAKLAPSVIGEAGIGGFKPADLEKLLAGKVVSGSPYVGNYTQGINGSTRPKDLETALQLLHLTFTRPTDRPEAFQVLKKRLASNAANRTSDPNSVYADSLSATNSMHSYMSRPLTPETVNALELKPSLDFYQARFANAADFTFFFVGNFKVEEITPLLAQYIGSLPSTGARLSKFIDRGLQFPPRVERVRVVKGIEPKSRTTITFFADTGLDEMRMHRARGAVNALRIRLRELLREGLGGTYGVAVNYANSQPLPGYAVISVAFGASPDNVDRMVDMVLTEVKRLQDEGPSPADIEKIQEIERRGLETSQKENGYWLGSLMTVVMLGWEPLSLTRRMDRIKLLTVDGVKEAFQKYFPLDRYTVVTLYPEAGATETGGAGK